MESAASSNEPLILSDESCPPAAKKAKLVSDEALLQQPAKVKKSKVALLMAYCGSGYQGMQINANAKTIEAELHRAFAESGAVSKDNAYDPQKIGFVRSCRTDKGVHAAGQVVSLKMLLYDDIIARINASLPKQIRVFGYVTTLKGFHAKSNCDSRFYEYIMPTYVFMKADPTIYVYSNIYTPTSASSPPALPDVCGKYETIKAETPTPEEMAAKRQYRCSIDTLDHLEKILNFYQGTRNYHNFTIGKKFSEKSSERYIISFKADKPFIKDGVEWISLKVHGQSFMLHQIRKMVGLAIMLIRTHTGIELIPRLFENVRVNIPKAPGVGLLLEQAVFSSYNEKIVRQHNSSEQSREEISFKIHQAEFQRFKEEWIYPKQMEEELKENSFECWIRSVDSHYFEFSWWLTRDGSIDIARKPASLEHMGRKLLTEEEEQN